MCMSHGCLTCFPRSTAVWLAECSAWNCVSDSGFERLNFFRAGFSGLQRKRDRRCRDFPHTPPQHMHRTPHRQYTRQNGTCVTRDEPALGFRSCLRFTLHLRRVRTNVECMCPSPCCHTEWFLCPGHPLFLSPTHPADTHLLTVYLILPFAECFIIGYFFFHSVTWI